MPFAGVQLPATFGDEGEGRDVDILIPEGDYLFELVRMRPSPEKVESGKEFIAYGLRIIDGHPHGVGKLLPHLGSISEGAGFTHNVLAALGFNVAQLKGMPLPTYAHFKGLVAQLETKLKGRKCGGYVYTDNYGGKDRSRVAQFYVAEKFVKQAAPAASAAQADLTSELANLINGNPG